MALGIATWKIGRIGDQRLKYGPKNIFSLLLSCLCASLLAARHPWSPIFYSGSKLIKIISCSHFQSLRVAVGQGGRQGERQWWWRQLLSNSLLLLFMCIRFWYGPSNWDSRLVFGGKADQWLFRKIRRESWGDARTQLRKIQKQLVPALSLFCHNDIDVTLTFRKIELRTMELLRNFSPNFHPERFTLVELQQH